MTIALERLAAKLTEGMWILLARHGEGWKSSLYCGAPGVHDPSRSPYWASFDCTYAPPNFNSREALILRGLIEPYHDAAGITPLGREVLALRSVLATRATESTEVKGS